MSGISFTKKNDNLPVLKTQYMIEEYENRRRKQVSLMRGILDYGIGIMIMLFGIFLVIRSRFNIPFNETYPPDWADKVFGGICIIYGGWRIYRGYRKNYFK